MVWLPAWMCRTNKPAKVMMRSRVEYCVYLSRRDLSITKLLNHKLAPLAVDYPFPPGGPLVEYKMFPTPKFARTFPYQVRLATSTTVTAPSFIIPPPPTNHPRSQVCVRAPLLRLEAKSPLTNPPSPQPPLPFWKHATFVWAILPLLSNKRGKTALWICLRCFLSSAGWAAGKEPLLHVLMTVLILHSVCELGLV